MKILLPLIITTILIWSCIPFFFSHASSLITPALLAWTLGLRHALDGDHIAAIDNITRHKTHNGHSSHTVGLFFSLGHSSVVLVTTAIILTIPFSHYFPWLQNGGHYIGSLISCLFLVIVGIQTVRSLRHHSHTHSHTLYRYLFPTQHHVWPCRHIFILGLLFGLSFDTATEISLLTITTQHSTEGGLSALSAMIFPTLFTVGMASIDTLDSYLMTYAWNISTNKHSQTKVHYQKSITIFSALTALTMSVLSLSDLLQSTCVLPPNLNSLCRWLSDHTGWIGASIILTFMIMWSIFKILTVFFFPSSMHSS